MMTSRQGRPERRHDVRISPKGTVIIRADNYVLRGRIANVSPGGIATTTRTTAPERLLGATVDLALRLDDPDASWIDLRGRILRIGANSIAIALVTVPPSFARIVEGMVARSHHNDRVLSIVLVDATTERRTAMAEGFRAVGCAVVEAASPLEAIVRLGESRFEPDLIAIGDSELVAVSEELRRFVEVEHPRARLVAIGDATTAPDGLALWLSSANPQDDLAVRIRKLLTTFGSS